MISPVFKMLFNNHEITKLSNTNIIVSSYIIENAYLAIQRLIDKYKNYNNDIYVINPLYYEQDTQIFITGTLKINEECIKGCIRELCEESRLSFKPFHVNKLVDVNESINKKVSWYECDISNATKYMRKEQLTNTKFNKNNTNNKIGIIVHGTKRNIILMMKNTCMNTNTTMNDSIVGLVAIKLTDIHKIIKCEMMNKNRRKSFLVNILA